MAERHDGNQLMQKRKINCHLGDCTCVMSLKRCGLPLPLLSHGPQHALEQELQQRSTTVGGSLPPTAQKAFLDTLSETLGASSKPRSPVRVEDLVRRSEVCTCGCVCVIAATSL